MFGMEPLIFVIIAVVVIMVLASIIKGLVAVSKQMLCPNCGTQGRPKTVTKGSILIEIVLWLCLIVPGLIYSIWRLTSRHKACPACDAPGMIPIDSPRAQQILGGK